MILRLGQGTIPNTKGPIDDNAVPIGKVRVLKTLVSATSRATPAGFAYT